MELSRGEKQILGSLKRLRNNDFFIPKRTIEYLQQGSAEGARNEELLAAACQLRDAQIPRVEVENLLMGRGSSDGLPESEIRATIGSCYNRPARETIETNPKILTPLHQENGAVYKVMPTKVYALDAGVILPEPIEDPSKIFLLANYEADEKVCIVRAEIDEDGSERPEGKGVTMSRDVWLKKMGDSPIGELFKSREDGEDVAHGVYVAINPLIDRAKGRKANNIENYRFALIEFDTISLERQWQLIKDSRIPCSTVSSSGNKSLHALVAVNAKDAKEYATKVAILFDHFESYDVDSKNKDPSRLTRMPGCRRGDSGREQTLIATNTGAGSWEEWVEYIADDFPPILSQAELYELDMEEPPRIIEGLLHRQLSMVLGGGAKTFKSWTLLDMAISVANGIPFWGCDTREGKVLYVNFEIPDWYFRNRIEMVCEAKDVKLPTDNLRVWNLRGKAEALEVIAPKFIKLMANGNFSMVILDPIYKTLGNRDENAAGDINSLMNEMEAIALNTGAAVVFAAHFSKGNQAAKSSIDRISGSGVFARSPDTILVMTEHEKEGCYTIEPTVRNHESPEPFVVSMQFPLFQREEEDPAKLKGSPGRPKEDATPYIMDYVRHAEDAVKQSDLIKDLAELGFTKSTVRRRIRELVEQGKLNRKEDPGKSSLLTTCGGYKVDFTTLPKTL